MQNELLDDGLNQIEKEDGGFILTETSTANLYEAVKWGRIFSVVVIVFSCIRLGLQLYQIIYLKTSALLSEISIFYSLISLFEPSITLICGVILYQFADNFLQGYTLDSDNLIDKSFEKLRKYFKYSTVSIGLSIFFVVLSMFLGDMDFSIETLMKYGIFIIPIVLLGVYYFQNRQSNLNE